MGSLKSNKLNNLTAKEWTQYSTSVILFSSKNQLIKRISRIYSKEKATIGYFNPLIKPKWKKRKQFSREFYSEHSNENKYSLIIVDLQDVKSISQYKKAEKWFENQIKVYIESLEDSKYLLVIANDFNDPYYKIKYFPTHYFLIQTLEKYRFLHTDLWALSNPKMIGSFSPTFLLCFKQSDNMLGPPLKYSSQDFINNVTKYHLRTKYIYEKIIQGFSSTRESEYLKHGATFPQPLIEYFIKIFTEEKDSVLDIFSGVGLSLFAAINLQRNAIGIELNPKYIRWTNNLKKRKFGQLMNYVYNETPNRASFKVINDDNRNLLVHIEKNSVDLMITSPPYFNILHKVEDEAEKRGTESVYRRRKSNTIKNLPSLYKYLGTNSIEKKSSIDTDNTAEQILSSSLIPHPYSGDDKDLGNITSYHEFLKEIEQTHIRVFKVLKPGSFALWIIKDFRDMTNNIPYVNFHSDLATLAIKNGFIYFDLLVWNQNRERRLIHLGGGNTYYNSMTMSFIVILQKPTKAKEKDY